MKTPSTELTFAERMRIDICRERARRFASDQMLRQRAGVSIGARALPGPALHRNSDHGVYWERQPAVEGMAARIQRALLETAENARINARCARIQALRGENWEGHYVDVPRMDPEAIADGILTRPGESLLETVARARAT